MKESQGRFPPPQAQLWRRGHHVPPPAAVPFDARLCHSTTEALESKNNPEWGWWVRQG